MRAYKVLRGELVFLLCWGTRWRKQKKILSGNGILTLNFLTSNWVWEPKKWKHWTLNYHPSPTCHRLHLKVYLETKWKSSRYFKYHRYEGLQEAVLLAMLPTAQALSPKLNTGPWDSSLSSPSPRNQPYTEPWRKLQEIPETPSNCLFSPPELWVSSSSLLTWTFACVF